MPNLQVILTGGRRAPSCVTELLPPCPGPFCRIWVLHLFVFWMDPTDFRNQYRSKHGAGFSISPLFRQSAWFRYKNRDPHVSNLFFVGAGTHPGAGMPGVLTSAKVLENLLKREGFPAAQEPA